jgi:hypothetical protein
MVFNEGVVQYCSCGLEGGGGGLQASDKLQRCDGNAAQQFETHACHT